MTSHGAKSGASWAVVLGVSSGFGAATARRLAADGYDVCGVHLDRRATLDAALGVKAAIEAAGRHALFFNVNAADPERRAEVVAALADAAGPGGVRLLFHSLAFGSLAVAVVPLIVAFHWSRLGWRDEHLPEFALLVSNDLGNEQSSRAHCAQRPFWLMPQPQALRQRGQQLYWNGPLALVYGPERIEDNWWQEAVSRDYYIAADGSGQHYWVFQDRLAGPWYIHGVFA